jgi:signal transduction histidine kinase
MHTTRPLHTTGSIAGWQQARSKTAPMFQTLLREGLRWAGAISLAFGITLTVLIAILRPSPVDTVRLCIYLGFGGLISIVLGEAALWLADAVSLRSIWLKIAIPPLLTAVVIALNVLLIARLMFISNEDGQLLLAFLVFGIAVAMLLSSSIAARMIGSIHRIGKGAMRIAEGDYGYRLDESATNGEDELAQLARWFNEMASGVQMAFERQQAAEHERHEVITAVSHDLRTPLASVRAMIEAIDDGIVHDPATVARYHRTIRAELRHLTSLLDDLFELSRIESRALALTREPMNIEDIISDVLESINEQAERAGVSLIGHVSGPLPAVSIDARQIHRALVNLLQNAIRYTPANGVILIHAACAPRLQGDQACGSVLVQVIDSGVGIAASDLPHIFERTYRGEASRRRIHVDATAAESAGAGLGLAITRGIVEAHGERIWAESPLADQTLERISGAFGGVQGMPGTALNFTLPLAEAHS